MFMFSGPNEQSKGTHARTARIQYRYSYIYAIQIRSIRGAKTKFSNYIYSHLCEQRRAHRLMMMLTR